MAKPYLSAAVAVCCAATITACNKPETPPPDTVSAAPQQVAPADPLQATATDPVSTMGVKPHPDLHIIRDYVMKPNSQGDEPAPFLEVSMMIPLDKLTETQRADLENSIKARQGSRVLSILADDMTTMARDNPAGLALVKAALGCKDLARPISTTTCTQ